MLSIVQLSRFLSFFSCDSFDILSNPIRFVKNFFIFLLFSPSLTSQLIYNTTYICQLSTIFYKFFNISCRSSSGTIYGIFTRYYHTIYSVLTIENISSAFVHLWGLKNYWLHPVVFVDNNERRRRDLNPRAATNDLLPFQGSPFGQLGYFSKMSAI